MRLEKRVSITPPIFPHKSAPHPRHPASAASVTRSAARTSLALGWLVDGPLALNSPAATFRSDFAAGNRTSPPAIEFVGRSLLCDESHLRFTTSHLRPGEPHLRFAASHLLSGKSHLRFTASHLLSDESHLRFTEPHLPPGESHLHFTASHLLPVESHLRFTESQLRFAVS